MAERLQLDDRIYNPYTVDDLEQSHPPVFAALQGWFAAVRKFEDGPILRFIGARTAADAAKHRDACQQSLAALPGVLGALDELIAVLDAGLAGEPAGSANRARLSPLADSARHNRRELGRMPEMASRALAQLEPSTQTLAGGEHVVESTAQKLEALALASQEQRSFTELRPLMEQLRVAWDGLDEALKDLPHAEQRRLRGEQHSRMQAAVDRLTANLLAARQRDRAAGLLAPPDYTRHAESVEDEFLVALLRADYDGACSLLAPWLGARWTPEALRQAVEAQYALAAAEVPDTSQLPPGDYYLSGNPLGLAELRGIQLRSWGEIPGEISEENYGGWKLFSILTDEDDAYLTNIENLASGFLIPVRTAAGERIGFLAFGEE